MKQITQIISEGESPTLINTISTPKMKHNRDHSKHVLKNDVHAFINHT